jgi:hypothetical protein
MVGGGFVWFVSMLYGSMAADAPLESKMDAAPQGTVERMKTRYNEAKTAYQEGEEVTVALTGEELRALGDVLRKQDEHLKVLEGSVSDGVLDLRLSYEYPKNPGTYLNIEARGSVSYTDGATTLSLQDLALGGTDLAGYLDAQGGQMQQMLAQNVTQLFQRLRQEQGLDIRGISVGEEEVTVRLKRARNGAGGAAGDGASPQTP